MQDKLTVGLIFGGRSAEHEVSVHSARNIAAALNPEKYIVRPIGIAKSGAWLFDDAPRRVLEDKSQLFLPEQAVDSNPMSMLTQDQSGGVATLDVLFPVLHGPYGEDGTIQGLAKLLDLPCVGAGVLGSAVSMDKDVMKRLLLQAGIPIVQHQVLRERDYQDGKKRLPTFEQLAKSLGSTLFVKPANLGSSIGISKVTSQAQLDEAIALAFAHDPKIIIEQGLEKVREIELSVLGNDSPTVSVPGELVVEADFYSYDAKYSEQSQTQIRIPADIPGAVAEKISAMAIQTYQALECQGMARVDFFYSADKKIYVNEINTLPGFTNISMYPKLWEASGVPQRELVDQLISLAIEAAG